MRKSTFLIICAFITTASFGQNKKYYQDRVEELSRTILTMTDKISDRDRKIDSLTAIISKYESIAPNLKTIKNSKSSTESEYSNGSSGSSSSSSYSTPNRTIQTGPRGGKYYINSSGKKTYVKK